MKRNASFDVVNVVSCFCVVLMHGNGVCWIYAEDRYWYQALLADVLGYFAVPCFFMLTGATLMEYRERYDTKIFLQKRLVRTLIPYILWAWFYLLLKIENGSVQLTEPLAWNEHGIFYQAFHSVWNYSSQSVFWYFPVLFNVYLCLPALSVLAGKEKSRLREYLLVVSFISIIFIPTINRFLGVEEDHSKQVYVMGGYLIYVLLGYHLTKKPISKWSEISIILLGAISIIVKYVGTIYASRNEETLSQLFYGYLSVFSFFQSISVFLIIGHIRVSESMKKPLQLLSSCSLGVYFIHKLVFALLGYITRWSDFSFVYRTVGVILVYCISVATVCLIKKIPLLNKLVP